ncbi:hypothetical protein JR316_0002399 [Psilocybe cubensis]|uniref:Uncharacterized protein n=2 Tax=Psilocybe cubensis TaxID=181762 RepID=A0A8H8CPE5_PSICU|nr:hypothetical protein JR316_0002399 [Psilocybe cubensis]KAH9485491.1 hypothetical protein JR316_0002399 [Psilocybe cubensis]
MADNIVNTNHTSLMTEDTHSFDAIDDRGGQVHRPTSSSLNALGPVVPESYPADRPFGGHASNPTTPGERLPGAFPQTKEAEHVSSLSRDADYVKEAASSALETAKDYVYSAGEVVGGYLPKSVAAYLPTNGSPRQGDEASQHHESSARRNETFTESHSYTPSGPEVHEDSSKEKNTLESVGITGTRVIEDRRLVGDTPNPSKSTTQDNNEPIRPQDNSLTLPRFGTTGIDYSISNNRSGAASTVSKQYDGASTDASTRTLAGSRIDTWSHAGTATSSTKEADVRNRDGTMKTSSSAADSCQRNHTIQDKEHSDFSNKADRPEFEHHPEEPHLLTVPPVSKSAHKSAAPHVNSPPVTRGREHFAAVEKSTKPRSDSKPFSHQDSLGSTVATPGHDGHAEPSGKGKENVSDVATNANSYAPTSAETGALAGAVTGTDTSSMHPTVNNPPTTDDTGAWAAKVVQGLDTPAAERNVNAQQTVGHLTPTAQVNTGGTDGNTPIISKEIADEHRTDSSVLAKTKGGSATKTKFMDKLRGEIKVLSGKLEKSPEKVQEGRRMMGKPTLKN